jgi:hypothetical protein
LNGEGYIMTKVNRDWIDLAALRGIRACDHHFQQSDIVDYFAVEFPSCDDCLLLVAQAVMEEAAKIADSFGAQAGNDASGGMAHVIAQQIRASSEGRNKKKETVQ